MHVAQINFLPAPGRLGPTELLEQWPSLADIPEAVATAGVRVSVIQAAARQESLIHHGVNYHFVDVGADRTVADRGRRLACLLTRIEADVLHVHGLGFARQATAVSRHLPCVPVLYQDHADRPPCWWRRAQWRRWYAGAAGFAFTARELARPFIAAGVFGAGARLFAIPESSCRFGMGDQASARSETGLFGDPCVVWVGHLGAGKDPLTVLEGVARAALQLPGLRLWCAFGSAPLLSEVKQRIARDALLAGRVHLLGRLPHARIERLMQSADLFVSGSLGESCGYALLEAMACGATPVVTNIPSFHALTDGGRIGELWPCAEPGRLAEALVRASLRKVSPARVRTHFDEHLSFKAVGRKWLAAYRQALEDRSGR